MTISASRSPSVYVFSAPRSLVSTFYLSSAVTFPPPWSLKAIIISLQRCQNPTLHLYLEEPYRDEWNLSADRDEWLLLRPALNFLIPQRL